MRSPAVEKIGRCQISDIIIYLFVYMLKKNYKRISKYASRCRSLVSVAMEINHFLREPRFFNNKSTRRYWIFDSCVIFHRHAYNVMCKSRRINLAFEICLVLFICVVSPPLALQFSEVCSRCVLSEIADVNNEIYKFFWYYLSVNYWVNMFVNLFFIFKLNFRILFNEISESEINYSNFRINNICLKNPVEK